MNSRNKNILLCILIVGIVLMSVAYAILSTNLQINGTANVAATRWDIHFQNFDDTQIPANTINNEPNTGIIKSVTTSATAITNLKADLKKPGDTIRYKFDIKNAGTIDAKLNSFSIDKNCSTSSACDDVTYTVTCLNGASAFVQGNVLAKNGTLNCELNMTYNANATNIVDDVVVNATADWNFVQN